MIQRGREFNILHKSPKNDKRRARNRIHLYRSSSAISISTNQCEARLFSFFRDSNQL